MTVLEQITELEAGFADLISGLRIALGQVRTEADHILESLRQENLRLEARLEESRQMLFAALARLADVERLASMPREVRLSPSSVDDVAVAMGEGKFVEPELRWKVCAGCGGQFEGKKTRRYCDPCLRWIRTRAAQKMRQDPNEPSEAER